MYFPCVYLGGEVKLTEERLQHILQTQPELSLIYQSVIAETLKDPEQVRRISRLNNTRLFDFEMVNIL